MNHCDDDSIKKKETAKKDKVSSVATLTAVHFASSSGHHTAQADASRSFRVQRWTLTRNVSSRNCVLLYLKDNNGLFVSVEYSPVFPGPRQSLLRLDI